MSKKIDIEKMKVGIQNALPNQKNMKNVKNVQENQFNKLDSMNFNIRYYNIETDEPIPLQEIEKRLINNYSKIEKISVEIMLDLYFIYCNWNTFYHRNDSFKKYLEENIPINRSYAYDIIKIVKMLIDFHVQESENVSYDTTHLFSRITNSLEKLGTMKLKTVSQIKEKDSRYLILNEVLNGKDFSNDRIISGTKEIANKKSNPIIHKKIKMINNDVFLNEEIILTFKKITLSDKNRIYDFIKKYFSN